MNEGGTAPLVNCHDFENWILFEDSELLVLDKPGWLVCHPSKNGPWSSLVGAAKEYLRVNSVHLVSRLDRETSGVVMLAKHKKAASIWQKGVETRNVKRSYLAILNGDLIKETNVITFLGKDPNSEVFVKQRVTEESRKAQRAETRFIPLGNRNKHTFALVKTETGRKHQIRVHAKHLGFFIVGDKLYGPDELYYLKFVEKGWDNKWKESLGMSRQSLHAWSLDFENLKQQFKAPVPNDMLDYLVNEVGWKSNEIHTMVSAAMKKLSCR